MIRNAPCLELPLQIAITPCVSGVIGDPACKARVVREIRQRQSRLVIGRWIITRPATEPNFAWPLPEARRCGAPAPEWQSESRHSFPFVANAFHVRAPSLLCAVRPVCCSCPAKAGAHAKSPRYITFNASAGRPMQPFKLQWGRSSVI